MIKKQISIRNQMIFGEISCCTVDFRWFLELQSINIVYVLILTD